MRHIRRRLLDVLCRTALLAFAVLAFGWPTRAADFAWHLPPWIAPPPVPQVAGFAITKRERQDVIAFLNSLTDETFLNDERFRSPFR